MTVFPMFGEQFHLFSASQKPEGIQGLHYQPSFLTQEDERKILDAIDNRGVWLNDLRRRVQHYGYRYDYKSRGIDPSMRAASFPGWLSELAQQVIDGLRLDSVFDQAIINEYLPGQGIYGHVDCEPCFDETIASLSLGSCCIMDFVEPETRRRYKLVLEPRSALLLQGEARYKWKHGIASRKFDEINGVRVARSRRVSITFRRVILGAKTGS